MASASHTGRTGQRREGGGGQVRVIASIEDPRVIGKILDHQEKVAPGMVGEGRGPPQGRLELG